MLLFVGSRSGARFRIKRPVRQGKAKQYKLLVLQVKYLDRVELLALGLQAPGEAKVADLDL